MKLLFPLETHQHTVIEIRTSTVPSSCASASAKAAQRETATLTSSEAAWPRELSPSSHISLAALNSQNFDWMRRGLCLFAHSFPVLLGRLLQRPPFFFFLSLQHSLHECTGPEFPNGIISLGAAGREKVTMSRATCNNIVVQLLGFSRMPLNSGWVLVVPPMLGSPPKHPGSQD